MDIPPADALPCPLSTGWELVEQRLIEPSQGGGFSAGAYRHDGDELWLLSDAPHGSISRWRGLRERGLRGLEPLPPLRLDQSQPMDGEGLVLAGPNLWLANEGRLQLTRSAGLLRYDLSTGQLQQTKALPPSWQLQAKRGLRSNGGPESLTRLPAGGALLMAAMPAVQTLLRSSTIETVLATMRRARRPKRPRDSRRSAVEGSLIAGWGRWVGGACADVRVQGWSLEFWAPRLLRQRSEQ